MPFIVSQLGACFYVMTRSRSAFVSGPYYSRDEAEREAGILNFGSDLSPRDSGPRNRYARAALRTVIAA